MQFEGTVNIGAPPEEVWDFLTNPDAVSQCAPGLQSMEVIEPDKKFRAVAAVGLGSIKAAFTTDVEWLELDKPNHAKMKAHGSGQGSGVDVTSDMYLSDGENGTTDLKWSAEISVVGMIANMASRMMGGVTQRLTDAFFDCVKQKIEG